MPRSLTFRHDATEFTAALVTIDRGRIYGTVEVVTQDHEGAEAQLMTLARDGRTLIGPGGTGSGYVNEDGLWVETGERIPVDAEGDPLDLVRSSFDAPIALDTRVEAESLLEHPVRLSYVLEPEGMPEALSQALAQGAIFSFGFSYRGGPVADPAFLLADTDGDLWLLVCNEAKVGFLGLSQAAVCAAAPDEEVEDDDEDDNFDFDML